MMICGEAKDSVESVGVDGARSLIVSGSVDGIVRVYDVRMGQLFEDTVGCKRVFFFIMGLISLNLNSTRDQRVFFQR